MPHDMDDLASGLRTAATQIAPALRVVVQEGMSDIKNDWADNARQTSGVHGKHYPNSITYETRSLVGVIVGEVGPDSSKPQGSMGRGFELGSVNQPPHLDGTRAASANAPRLQARFSTAIAYLMP